MVCYRDSENINDKMDDDALKQEPKCKYLRSTITEGGENWEGKIKRITEAKGMVKVDEKPTNALTIRCVQVGECSVLLMHWMNNAFVGFSFTSRKCTVQNAKAKVMFNNKK
jgi:hypothetical protein